MGSISYRNRNKGKLDANGRNRKANWEYRFFGAPIDGKAQRFEKCGFKTKEEAVKAGTKAYNEYMRAGSVFAASSMSYSDCLESWMKNYVAIRCTRTTQEGYRTRIDMYINPALGKYKISALKRDSIQSFINKMYFDKYSRNTLVSVLGIITSSLRYARRQEWIQSSPAEDIDLPVTRECTEQRHKERNAIPKEIMEKILIRFPEGHPEHLPIMLAYHCGLRLGETFGLTWDNIDLENGILTVEHQVQRYDKDKYWRLVPPKYNSKRTIHIDNVLLELLKREKARQEQGRAKYEEEDKDGNRGKNVHIAKNREPYHYLYVDDQGYINEEGCGEPIRMVTIRENGSYIQPRVTQHLCQVVHKELDYPQFDFHSLRHTHATELCEAGVNLKEIQRRLGHKTLEVTSRRYIHATDWMESQSVEIMNEMYKEA